MHRQGLGLVLRTTCVFAFQWASFKGTAAQDEWTCMKYHA